MATEKQKNLERRSFIRMTVFGFLTVVFVVLSVVGLVNNSNGARDRYNALIAVDQAGGDVEASLNELRGFIYSHMNTQIGSDLGINPPIQLKSTYERLVAAERDRVARINENLQAEATAYCESTQSEGLSGRFRVDCVAAYIDENGVKEQPIEDDFYKFDFAPPLWSPDLAGFSILLAIVCGLIFLIDIILYFRTRHMVHMAN